MKGSELALMHYYSLLPPYPGICEAQDRHEIISPSCPQKPLLALLVSAVGHYSTRRNRVIVFSQLLYLVSILTHEGETMIALFDNPLNHWCST